MDRKHKTIPIFVPHWGCPQDCIFCDQKKITGQKEPMTPEKAAEIIARGAEGRKPEDYIEIGFFGGSFTGIPATIQEEFLGLAMKAVQKGEADSIRLSTRPDYIDDAVIERLLHFGVKTVELGAQSMEDAVLTACHRGHSAEDTQKAAQKIKDAGLSLGLQMMLGLLGDTEEKALETARAFMNLKPACVRIYPTLVLKGTALESLYEKGDYTPLALEKAADLCAKLYRMFTESGIEVIRMGLLEVEEGALAAGPFHPAFGEMVMSRVYYQKLSEMLSSFSGKTLRVELHPKDVSPLVGQRKENIRKIQENFGVTEIKLLQNEKINRGAFRIY